MKNTFIYLVGEILNKIAPFLLLPYITRSLGVSEYGDLAYIQTLAVLLAIPIGLSQQSYIRKIKFTESKMKFNDKLMIIFIHNVIISFLFSLLLYWWLNNVFFIVTIAFLQITISTILTVIQCDNKPLKYVLVQIMNTMLTLVLTVLFFEIDASYKSRLYAIIFSGFFSILVAFFIYGKINYRYKQKKTYNYKRFFFSYKRSYLNYLNFGFLLLLSQVSFYIRSQFERYILKINYESSELGLYMLSFQISSIILILSNSVLVSLQPVLLKFLKENGLSKNILIYISLSVIGSLCSYIFFLLIPKSLVVYIFGYEFGDALNFMPAMAGAFALMLTIGLLTEILVFYGRNNIVSNISLCITIIYMPMVCFFSDIDLYLIPYALFIVNLLQMTILFYFVVRLKKDTN